MTKKYLSFLVLKENEKYNKSCKKLSKVPKEVTVEISSEEELIEQWREETIANIVKKLLSTKVITSEQFRILWLWVIERKSQQEIAEEHMVSRQAITKRIQNIQQRVAKILNTGIIYEGNTKELFDSILYKAIMNNPRSRQRDAHSPRIKMRYPSEFFMCVNNGQRKGKNGYTNLTKCVLPEFLSECFGDDKTKCGCCISQYGENNCSRKEDN